MPMTPTIAFLSGGRLFLCRPGSRPEQVESLFGQDLLDEQTRIRERHEWKARTDPGRMMGGAMWPNTPDAGARPIRISSAAPAFQAGEWLYALDMGEVGGLFIHEAAERAERRLFHHHRLHLRHLAAHPDGERIAFSQPSDDGVAHIAVTDPAGKRLHTVTEGDSLDETPSWVPGSPDSLLFQSAGIGRDTQGRLAGVGAYHIGRLDLSKGSLETVLEQEGSDLLMPRADAEGNLYFIRRPYVRASGPSLGNMLLDIALFPVRLLWALVSFLHFLSQMFAGKPLITAGQVKKEGPDERFVTLHGMALDARKAEKEARKGEPAALVPRTWQLVRRGPSGVEQVLADHVAAYDLCPDGAVVFTNGSAVYLLREGNRELLCTGARIEAVKADPRECGP